jgi:hypothetical protein
MIKLTQTKQGLKNSNGKRITYGNCLVTCIACILEVPIDEMPNIQVFYEFKNPPVNHADPSWHIVMNMWLKLKFGLSLDKVEIHPKQQTDRTLLQRLKKGSKYDWVIARGLSPRGTSHCIIMNLKHQEPAWDPSPSREGLTEIHHYWKLVKV